MDGFGSGSWVFGGLGVGSLWIFIRNTCSFVVTAASAVAVDIARVAIPSTMCCYC